MHEDRSAVGACRLDQVVDGTEVLLDIGTLYVAHVAPGVRDLGLGDAVLQAGRQLGQRSHAHLH
eukprot:scaffold58968_cov33-Phaeocystis_antarctica.AAC.1